MQEEKCCWPLLCIPINIDNVKINWKQWKISLYNHNLLLQSMHVRTYVPEKDITESAAQISYSSTKEDLLTVRSRLHNCSKAKRTVQIDMDSAV